MVLVARGWRQLGQAQHELATRQRPHATKHAQYPIIAKHAVRIAGNLWWHQT
jgi:hypothetical protein